MSKVVELEILGEPMGKQRPRYSNYKGAIRTYTPQKTINYESLIINQYNERYGKLMFDKDDCLYAIINAYFSLSKGDYGKKGLNKSGRDKMECGYCTKNVDADNIAKIVLDALNSICFFDDKQVVCLMVHKYWTDETPKVVIHIEKVGKSYGTH